MAKSNCFSRILRILFSAPFNMDENDTCFRNNPLGRIILDIVLLVTVIFVNKLKQAVRLGRLYHLENKGPWANI